jgi:hypothetical protein
MPTKKETKSQSTFIIRSHLCRHTRRARAVQKGRMKFYLFENKGNHANKERDKKLRYLYHLKPFSQAQPNKRGPSRKGDQIPFIRE